MAVDNEGTNPGSAGEPLEIKIEFGKVTYHSKYESSIPRDVTNKILAREQLPREIPKLGSSIIEDFILDKIKAGDTANNTIVDAFFAEEQPQKVKEFVERVKARSEQVDWPSVFSADDAKQTQLRVTEEMAAIGMSPDQIASVAAMGIEIGENIGASSLSNEMVFASRLQAVRRAMDYMEVFKDDGITFEQVLRAQMIGVVGHELGHRIDELAGRPINTIPSEWRNAEDESDNKSERFAEYWGGVGFGKSTDLLALKSKEWLIHLAKVTQLWDAIGTYNQSHNEKIDLYAIYRGIDEKLASDDTFTSALLWARRSLYGGNEVENYASPYSKETVIKAINETTTEVTK